MYFILPIFKRIKELGIFSVEYRSIYFMSANALDLFIICTQEDPRGVLVKTQHGHWPSCVFTDRIMAFLSLCQTTQDIGLADTHTRTQTHI